MAWLMLRAVACCTRADEPFSPVPASISPAQPGAFYPLAGEAECVQTHDSHTPQTYPACHCSDGWREQAPARAAGTSTRRFVHALSVPMLTASALGLRASCH